MNHPGDMWRVAYPADTGPRHAPLSLERTEAPPMVEDKDFVYVDLYGNEVSPDDPAAQTKYHPAELKTLRKGGFFPKRGNDAVVDAAADAADAAEGTPVLNSGVGARDAEDDDADDKAARTRGAKK